MEFEKRTVYRTFIAVGLLCLFSWLLWPVTTLEIQGHESGMTTVMPVEDGQSMVYSSIHSVSGSRLEETLVMTKKHGFETVKVKYEDQGGAGLPEYVGKSGEFYIDNGWFVIEGVGHFYESLSLQVDRRYDNRLEVNGEELMLYLYCEEGQGVVHMNVTNRPKLWVLLLTYL